MDFVDGLILIGGSDIDPDHYGGNKQHPQLQQIDAERDTSELALVDKRINEKRLPTLCICRGIQVANVVQGGTLHEDNSDLFPEDIHRSSDKGWTKQFVKAQPGSLLA